MLIERFKMKRNDLSKHLLQKKKMKENVTKKALRDQRYCLEASREFVVCLFLDSCVSFSKSVCFVIFL